jgi:hypothetical protein
MQIIRQSTASQEISLGFFLDSTDGDTEEAGLTIANTDIKLRKGGTTTLANKNSGGATSISNGIYHATLDATDTDTVGMLEIYVHVAGALAVKNIYMVIEETVYDLLYASGATGDVKLQAITHTGATIPTVTTATTVTNQVTANVTAISGDTTAADNLELDYDGTGFSKGNSTIGACTTNTDMRGTDSAAKAVAVATIDTNVDSILVDTGTTIPAQITALNDFDPATDTVVNVTTVATTTTNTDMRGTDGANTVAPDNSTISSIKVDTGTTLPVSISAIPSSVMAAGDIDGNSLEEAQKLIQAASVGKVAGAATTTVTIRAADDSKNRITATVDASGNRTAVKTDVTG